MGELVLSTRPAEHASSIDGAERVRVGAGVTLVDLDAALARVGPLLPAVPTFTGAFAGGIVATNAAGAATFKYGTTRDWVQGLTVVLANGDVLDVERGRHDRRPRRLDSRSSCPPATVRTLRMPGYRMPACAEALGRLFRRAGRWT